MHDYCMTCREQREMNDVQQVLLKHGREARQGTYAASGTAITVLGEAPVGKG